MSRVVDADLPQARALTPLIVRALKHLGGEAERKDIIKTGRPLRPRLGTSVGLPPWEGGPNVDLERALAQFDRKEANPACSANAPFLRHSRGVGRQA
jgi:hypothetical protein